MDAGVRVALAHGGELIATAPVAYEHSPEIDTLSD
jgi:hypothetical protein